MLRKTLSTVALLIALIGALVAGPAADAGPARYEVVSADSSLRRGLAVHHELGYGFSATLTSAQVARLRARGAQVDPVAPRSIGCHKSQHRCGGGGDTTRATPSDRVPYGIEFAYNIGATQTHPSPSAGAGVNVAVLDTGANKEHLDLKNRITLCKDATGNGIVDGCLDGNGHGTHTAGTIAADGGSDGLGIRGVAPGASLWIYKVCGSNGWCYSDDIARAIDDASTRGANIVSMSIGGDSPSSLELEAIQRAVDAGVLVVAAAGNDGPAGGTIDWPGAFKEVVAVAAINSSKVVANWSSRGIDDGHDTTIVDREVEFAEAGVSVLSTWKDGKYATISGTSMATPHLSGIAAARWVACGGAGAIRSCLRDIGTDITVADGGGASSGYDIASGYGLARVR